MKLEIEIENITHEPKDMGGGPDHFIGEATIMGSKFHVHGVRRCETKANGPDGVMEPAGDACDLAKDWFEDFMKLDEGCWESMSLEEFGLDGRWFVVFAPFHVC